MTKTEIEKRISELGSEWEMHRNEMMDLDDEIEDLHALLKEASDD